MTTARSTKLGWIILACAIFGFLLAEVLGVVSQPVYLVMVGIPILLGAAFGFVGFAGSGETRNRNAILWMAAVVGLSLLSIAALATHALLNSTDL